MFKHTYWFPFFAQSKECHTNDAYTNVAKCVGGEDRDVVSLPLSNNNPTLAVVVTPHGPFKPGMTLTGFP